MDLEAAVMSFTRPEGEAPLDGPEPRNGTSPINPAADEGAFTPWLDRMVRSRVALAAGTWELWCNLPGHEQLGMAAQVTVADG